MIASTSEIPAEVLAVMHAHGRYAVADLTAFEQDLITAMLEMEWPHICSWCGNPADDQPDGPEVVVVRAGEP